jgi:hypothetical protein
MAHYEGNKKEFRTSLISWSSVVKVGVCAEGRPACYYANDSASTLFKLQGFRGRN